MNKDISKHLYAPMLSLNGGLSYQRKITDGLWTILTRARQLASEHKETLIQNGRLSVLNFQGSIRGNTPITFVIYHVPFEAKADQSIGSFDVPVIDNSKINHSRLLHKTIESIHRSHPNVEVVLCTDKEFGAQMKHLDVSLVYPDVELHRPMYYRAKTYNTLVQGGCLQGTVVFMDSDAVVLQSMEQLPESIDFDVAVTQRFAPNLMPINEGVIIAKLATQTTINFFAHYMGIYELIKNDAVIKSICGNDLMRWRGGQLSLNAILTGGKMKTHMSSDDLRLKILDCHRFNRAVSSIAEVEDLLKQGETYVAHMKGKAKFTY